MTNLQNDARRTLLNTEVLVITAKHMQERDEEIIDLAEQVVAVMEENVGEDFDNFNQTVASVRDIVAATIKEIKASF